MRFEYTEEQLAFQKAARQFIEREMAPEADECDRKSVFPRAAFRRFGEAGFLGVAVPRQYGGQGLGAMEYCLLSEELGRLSAGYTHNGLFQTQKMLVDHGTEKQKERFLPGLAGGALHAGTAISEPGMGSHFSRMQTRARRMGDTYLLDGVKTHINDAAEADVINVFARAEKGLAIFLVEKGTPGLRITRKLDPMGMRASPIYEFELKRCAVPEENLLGEEGRGLSVFVDTFNFSRMGNASAFLGMAKAALETALEYARNREIGERRVTDFQGIRWLVAELSTKLEAAELLRNKAAATHDRGEDASTFASMAKLFCGEVAQEVIPAAISMTGSHGCYRDTPFERWLRDTKALEIAGGTAEVMKNTIARQILDKARK